MEGMKELNGSKFTVASEIASRQPLEADRYPGGPEVVVGTYAAASIKQVELADVAREAGFDPAEFGL